jgi:hypothetical protein
MPAFETTAAIFVLKDCKPIFYRISSPVLAHQKHDQHNNGKNDQHQRNDLPRAKWPFAAYLAGITIDGKLVGFVFINV